MNQPKRLDKKSESSNIDRVIAWANAHATPLLVVLIFILYIVIILLLRQLWAMESGMMRNFIINGV